MDLLRPAVWLGSVILVLAAWLVFSPSFHGDWLWDDDQEITDNPVLRDAAGLSQIWWTTTSADYFPLKTTWQWIEWHLWGDRPFGYHLASFLLHLLSCFLIWRLFARLGIAWAWWGALLFAVHPLTAESVAWISEQKNTTSLPLLLLSMLFYLAYDAKKGAWAYAASLASFAAALLCKNSVIMLPCVLALYLWWRRGGRFSGGKDWLALVPFFLLSLVLGLVGIWFQHHNAIAGMAVDAGSIPARIARAGLAVFFYAFKVVWPFPLMPIYPDWPSASWKSWAVFPWIALAALFLFLWSRRQGRGRHALLGLNFFVLNLLPALGLIAMSFQRLSWVSDHFAYVALIGPAGLAVAGAKARLGPGREPAPPRDLGAGRPGHGRTGLAMPASGRPLRRSGGALGP